MFMHSERLTKIKEVIKELGELKRITSHFSFLGSGDFAESNIRTSSELEPLGCVGDLGWYNIRFALWVMDFQMPQQVIGRFLKQHQRGDCSDSVPIEIEGELHFEGGVTAAFYNSFVSGYEQWANISGTEGYLSVQDFVNPFAGPSTKFQMQHPARPVDERDFAMLENGKTIVVDQPGSSGPHSQETNLFRNFGSTVLSGQVDEHWPNISLHTQKIADAVVASARQDSRPIVTV